MNIEFSDKIEVTLIDRGGDDSSVARAARVSIRGGEDYFTRPGEDLCPLIDYLMSSRHGSPFEHNFFTFYINAPIFVIREWQRHRISSFNERSGRYSKLTPKFYIPNETRMLVNSGNSARPKFVARYIEETDEQVADRYDVVKTCLKKSAILAWDCYEAMLHSNVAKEVARMALPLNIYSEMYWTVNARSLMNFLSLRVESVQSQFPSHPQYEIDEAARQVEAIFSQRMPFTYRSFVSNGRVAP